MAQDSSLYLRKAIIAHLRADADVTALVPAGRIYGLSVPPNAAKPFIRYGVPSVLPQRSSCMDGVRVAGAIHCFSDQDSEDEASLINAAVAKSLDGDAGNSLTIELDAPYAALAHIAWSSAQILADPEEASTWHGINSFEASVAS